VRVPYWVGTFPTHPPDDFETVPALKYTSPTIVVVCLAFCLGAVLPISAGAYEIVPSKLGLTYENFRLSDDENMGVLGGGYTVRVRGSFEAGLGIFGAVKGERGGFFTGGALAGYHDHLFRRLHFDAGVFAGAGGGGAAPQGGGFMLRTHAGFTLDYEDSAYGLGYSWVTFPNGDITSNQVVMSVSHPFGLLLEGGWHGDGEIDVFEAIPDTHHRFQAQKFDATLIIATPVGGTVNTSGQVQDGGMAMVGVAWERAVSDRGFFELSLAGSMGGASDGYAQGLIDMGSRIRIVRPLALVLGGGLGLAGGGRVDTGGGAVADAFAKLELLFDHGYHLGVGAGVIGAVDGEFLASRLHVDLGYAFETPVPTGGWRVPGSQVYSARNMRLRLVHQTEIPADGVLRKDGEPDRTINLAGLKGDVMISESLFITGQTMAAYDGGAGGYAVGLAGLGGEWILARRSPWVAGLEALVGAAGGGGIEVQGGLIAQATAGIGYRFQGVHGVWLRYGRSGSIRESLGRNVVSLDYSFRFSTLMR